MVCSVCGTEVGSGSTHLCSGTPRYNPFASVASVDGAVALDAVNLLAIRVNGIEAQVDRMARSQDRKDFAKAAMQGFCASIGFAQPVDVIAEAAVEQADALLAELEKDNGTTR